MIDRGGEVVFEVVHDGQGKMKDRLGNRQIALNTPEYASSRQGSRFAWFMAAPTATRNRLDFNLKHYARIGCQFDLPLFHYRELLESAAVSVKDGAWNGRLPGGDRVDAGRHVPRLRNDARLHFVVLPPRHSPSEEVYESTPTGTCRSTRR